MVWDFFCVRLSAITCMVLMRLRLGGGGNHFILKDNHQSKILLQVLHIIHVKILVFLFKSFIGVYLIYSAMLVSGVCKVNPLYLCIYPPSCFF